MSRASIPASVYLNGDGNVAMFDTPLGYGEAYEAHIPRKKDDEGYPDAEFLCFDDTCQHFCVWQIRRVRIEWSHVAIDGFRAIKTEECAGPAGERFVRVIGGWRDDALAAAPEAEPLEQFTLELVVA